MAGPAKPAKEELGQGVKVKISKQRKSDERSQNSEDSNAQFIEQLMLDSQPQQPPSPNPPQPKKTTKAEKAEARKAKAEAKKAKLEAKETKAESKEPKVEPKKAKAESHEEEQPNLVNKTNALLESELRSIFIK